MKHVFMGTSKNVIPTKVGIQNFLKLLDSGFRRNDKYRIFRGVLTFFILFGFAAFCLTACGGTAINEGENYGDILDTSQGLTLTQSEHTIGWTHSECTMCHNLENIHLVDRTGVTDIVAVHNQAIRDGIIGCAACHGTNGVP